MIPLPAHPLPWFKGSQNPEAPAWAPGPCGADTGLHVDPLGPPPVSYFKSQAFDEPNSAGDLSTLYYLWNVWASFPAAALC